MNTTAVVMEGPEKLSLRELALRPMTDSDVVVEVRHSGISTGTERLFYTGAMPPFPGMGYPLVPGYESVGTIVEAGLASPYQPGESVFVPGANCFEDARCLFGGTAEQLVVPCDRIIALPDVADESSVVLALAATAAHALALGPSPDLVVGHGVLGRLLARIAIANGSNAPTVWEQSEIRRAGRYDYPVCSPDEDDRHNYRCIIDASGDPAILDTLIPRLAPGGLIILAGFYSAPLTFNFAPAFMREAQIRVAAEWKDRDMDAVLAHIESGRLSCTGLVTHRAPAGQAVEAYSTAFNQPDCLKMVIDWGTSS